jgi:hypothetical protein
MSESGESLFRAITPSKIESLTRKAGLKISHHIGTDGISYVIYDKINSANDYNFKKWVDYIYENSEESSILGYSMHGLLIVQK